MSSHIIEDLTSCILDFQANMVRVTYRKKTTIVEPDIEPGHTASLDYTWTSSRAREEPDVEGGTIKWRKLGFDSEDLMQEFAEVGMLGLDCLVCFSSSYFSLENPHNGWFLSIYSCACVRRNTLWPKTRISLPKSSRNN